ncbi:HAMP domain-containing histidine kinase [Protaetiibacter sp. SSC-01]|uniref:sensor histidine kinase n=1 Tax=Protaetiibacter sp. SSC-01 TaxID=2759943 RepID=UPI0016573B8B|nr:HAMP domain-containing sensor histidine kinase [Protaetiibacter sp. SSC-01]QNO37972.1 HAMP domain-containing histidine kinase [Protaetiibacter sp. SSC-01]
MAKLHASFERWWNGVSLRTKITGVTVLLLTFGLAVAGMGTMTVLRTYLFDQRDASVSSWFQQVVGTADSAPDNLATCNFRYEPGYLVAIVDASGGVVCENVPRSSLQPDFSHMTLSWGYLHDSNLSTVTDATGRGQWRVMTSVLTGSDGSLATLVAGIDVTDIDTTITRYSLIFFLFAIAVVLLGAAVTQLLVTSTFAPLRDVERTAARFAAGDYSQRLGGATPNTEVGRLNRSLNAMLARIDLALADRQRAVEQMRRFVGDASHELRTPLVSLRGYAELYRMGALQKPDDVAQAMDRIEREAIRMGGLVEDLLELARLDEPRTVVYEPVDLLPIAQDAALDASASAPLRRITVVVPEPIDPPADAADGEAGAASATTTTPPVTEPPAARPATAAHVTPPATTMTGPIAFAGSALARLRRRRPAVAETTAASTTTGAVPLPEVGPIVRGDEDKLRQVVTNLIGNAMRFTPDDSPIELEVGVDRRGGYGVISIVDHGEGIPPQLREKIFQRFWRADTSRTRETGGSGLGLAIVAGIVAKHDGHVEVLETPGGGATFRVSIPLAPSPDEEPESTDAAAAPNGTAPRP